MVHPFNRELEYNEHKNFQHFQEGISDNNPMCDLDSHTKSSYDQNQTQKSRNKVITQSKSFNNLLRNSKINLIQEENENNLKTHFDNFTMEKQEGLAQNYEITPTSRVPTQDQNKCICRSHYSSIHRCKPTCIQGPSFNEVKRTGKFNGGVGNEMDNFMRSQSITSSERIGNGNNEFTTYSNISAVPNHADEYVYSSVDEMAELMNTEKENKHYGFKRIKKQQSRYNDSFGVNELNVDTSPNALLLK